jgi:hypothetical protein
MTDAARVSRIALAAPAVAPGIVVAAGEPTTQGRCDDETRLVASRLLDDKAFEVRETAMKVLGITPPPEVKRGYPLPRKRL